MFIYHPRKKNGKQWLRLGQTKSYPKQKCVKVKSKKNVEGQGLKVGGVAGARQQ
jgi:hypothetical protein